MTLRARIALIAAAAVAVAVVAASVGLYLATQRTLLGTIDEALVELSRGERGGPDGAGPWGGGGRYPGPGPRPGRFGGAGGFVQAVTDDGEVMAGPGGTDDPLPVSERAREVAAGEQDAFFETIEVDEVPVRILTSPVREGMAMQAARPLGEVEGVLGDLRRQLVVASVLGVLLAAALGTVVARRAVRPVEQLTALAEQVAATQDLSRRIASERTDEVGRLAAAFDRMLGELEQARDAQEQLVADASHELRTPLTSLRTNIETLAHLERLPTEDRRGLIDDVVGQLDEFGTLVSSLVELARGARPVGDAAHLRLDTLVARAVDRVPRDDARIHLDVVPVTIVGDGPRLERAVTDVLENARKYAPGADVEVAVHADGRIVVRDHGPGVPVEDQPRVFDRFHRAAAARSAPGSGLGLAIVRQVVESHGGHVEVEDAPGGGARFILHLPPIDDDAVVRS